MIITVVVCKEGKDSIIGVNSDMGIMDLSMGSCS